MFYLFSSTRMEVNPHKNIYSVHLRNNNYSNVEFSRFSRSNFAPQTFQLFLIELPHDISTIFNKFLSKTLSFIDSPLIIPLKQTSK